MFSWNWRLKEKGGPKKSWEECGNNDLMRFRLKQEAMGEHKRWRGQIKAKIPKSGLPR